MEKEYFEYQLVFKKEGLLKYISHLDLLRLFQRVVRRANLPVVFSKGFHPLPKLKIQPALKLGIESDNLKLFIKLNKNISNRELKDRLNSELPDEIKVL